MMVSQSSSSSLPQMSVVESPNISKAAAEISAGSAAQAQKGLVGSLIADRYQVIGELGAGGMSTVYKARHVHLDKVFALKVLHESSEASLQRFLLEGQASTMLHHPNIVTVHDLGLHNGRAFMILDYVEGISLEDLITKEGAIEPARAMRIFAQICSALAHAHEQGVVHRDIKPSNIIISKIAPDHERVIVLDFGIAKILRPSDTGGAQNLTRTGEVFGTPLYMSPEQCEGRTVDARTDIYALGCVMYETLTGNPPFEGYNFFNTIYKQIKEAPPPFPSELRRTRMGVQLECVVLKAMAKSPQNRHKFMLELSSDLKEIELGTTGTVGNVFSSLKLMAGRLNAIERTRFLLGTGMQALTVIAVLMSLALFTLPGKLEDAYREAERNSAIIEAVKIVIKNRFDTDAVLSLDRKDMHETMEVVEKLCQQNPQQFKISQEFSAAADEGFAESKKVPELFKQIIFLQNPDDIRDLKKALNHAVKHWARASKLSSDLVSVSYSDLAKLKDNIFVMSAIFNTSKWGGILVELLLLAVILRSFHNLKRQKQLPDLS